MSFDFALFIDNKWDWSQRTFGPGKRTAGIIDHIIKELKEINDEPEDLLEWVDIIFLALDGASRAGHSAEAIIDAMLRKHAKNLMREWPDWRTMSEDVAIEHVREK